MASTKLSLTSEVANKYIIQGDLVVTGILISEKLFAKPFTKDTYKD